MTIEQLLCYNVTSEHHSDCRNYTIWRQTNESNFSRNDLIGNNRLQLYPTVCD